jgi:ribonuclease-3
MAGSEEAGRARAADWVRRKLGYQPLDPMLFERALKHRSAGPVNNERLEFLGDAVLNLIVAGHLYRQYSEADEGAMTRLRASVVNGESLARVAAGLELGPALELGAGELKTGGFRRESILADAFEAVCGAVFLEGGFETARE